MAGGYPECSALGIACVGLFVLTSGAMANDITPAVRSELAPSGKLRVGINHGNFLLVVARLLGDRAARCRARPGARARQAAGRAGGVLQVRDGRRARRRRPDRRVGRGVPRRGAPARHRDRVHRGLSRDSRRPIWSPPARRSAPLADVDKEGVRIAVAEKSAYELYLSRNIKHAKLILTKGIDASYNAFVNDRLEVLSGPAAAPADRRPEASGRADPRRAVHGGPAGGRHPEGPADRRELPPRDSWKRSRPRASWPRPSPRTACRASRSRHPRRRRGSGP